MTKKKEKRTKNDLQNITHKTKDRATQTPGVNSGAPERYAVLAPHVTPFVNYISTGYLFTCWTWDNYDYIPGRQENSV